MRTGLVSLSNFAVFTSENEELGESPCLTEAHWANFLIIAHKGLLRLVQVKAHLRVIKDQLIKIVFNSRT